MVENFGESTKQAVGQLKFVTAEIPNEFIHKLSALNRLVEMATQPHAFLIDSMIYGYHEYRLIWTNPTIGAELVCECELRNSYNPHAVAVKKAIGVEMKIVGHACTKKFLAICSLFIRSVDTWQTYLKVG